MNCWRAGKDAGGKKLAAAALAGLFAGLVVGFLQLPALPAEESAPSARGVAAGVLLLLIVTAAAGMLTRMTFRELSKMHLPAGVKASPA